MQIETKELSFKLWPDLEQLFYSSNGCDGCWCMNHRVKPENEVTGEEAKNALKNYIKEGKAYGVLAYMDATPVGWCAVDRQADLPGHDCAYPPLYQNQDDIWSIHCLYVHPNHRNKGVSQVLIKSALDVAKKHGAKMVEGYPTPKANQEAVPGVMSFSGRISTFEKIGFQLVGIINDFYTRMVKKLGT